ASRRERKTSSWLCAKRGCDGSQAWHLGSVRERQEPILAETTGKIVANTSRNVLKASVIQFRSARRHPDCARVAQWGRTFVGVCDAVECAATQKRNSPMKGLNGLLCCGGWLGVNTPGGSGPITMTLVLAMPSAETS